MFTVTPYIAELTPFKFRVQGEILISDIIKMMSVPGATKYICHAIYNIVNGENPFKKEIEDYGGRYWKEHAAVREWVEEQFNLADLLPHRNRVNSATQEFDKFSKSVVEQVMDYTDAVIRIKGACVNYENTEYYRGRTDLGHFFERMAVLKEIHAHFPDARIVIDVLMTNVNQE
jgi:hypothetical protein